jgi:hypothetical protein
VGLVVRISLTLLIDPQIVRRDRAGSERILVRDISVALKVDSSRIVIVSITVDSVALRALKKTVQMLSRTLAVGALQVQIAVLPSSNAADPSSVVVASQLKQQQQNSSSALYQGNLTRSVDPTVAITPKLALQCDDGTYQSSCPDSVVSSSSAGVIIAVVVCVVIAVAVIVGVVLHLRKARISAQQAEIGLGMDVMSAK